MISAPKHCCLTVLFLLLSGSNLIPDVSPSPAAEPVREVFSEPSATLHSSLPPAEGSRRGRSARVHPSFLEALEALEAGPDLSGTLFRFNLFPGTEPVARLKPAVVSRAGARIYSGVVEGIPHSRVLLARQGEALAGSLFIPGEGSFQILHQRNNFYEINERDPMFVPECGVPHGGPRKPVDAPDPGPQRFSLQRQHNFPSGTSSRDDAAESIEESPVIEVMVVYTTHAREGAGGTNAILAQIHLAMAEANLVMENSGIATRLRLVHAAEISYAETGDFDLDLSRLRGMKDGHLDEVHAWREEHRADLVSLFLETSQRYAGLAYLSTNAESAFSVVQRRHATTSFIFAHELGHNFGCDHDRQNTTGLGKASYSNAHRFTANGRTYRTVMSYHPQTSPSISVTVRPANDDFSNRIPLIGPDVEASTYLYAATGEPGEPAHFGPAVGTAWWTWTAPLSGVVRVALSPSSQPVFRVAIYQGDTLPELRLVAKTMTSLQDVHFNAIKGEIYQIALIGERLLVKVHLQMTLSQPPPNDLFANATRVEGLTATLSGSTMAASREEEEPPIGLAPFGHSIWFAWTSPADGRLAITPSNLPAGILSSDFAVFTGDELSNLNQAANSTQARNGFGVESGTTYYIGVDGPYAEVGLNLKLTPSAINDRFKNRLSITEFAGALEIENFAASREPGEPLHSALPGGRSLWWSWRAPSDGGLSFMTWPENHLPETPVPDPTEIVIPVVPVLPWIPLENPGSVNFFIPPIRIHPPLPASSPDCNVAVYTGDSLGNLVKVASHEFTSGGNETFGIPVAAGTDYIIAVESEQALGEQDRLWFEFAPLPLNDRFAHRFSTNSLPQRLEGTTLGAGAEPGEPFHAGKPPRHSVWWSFTFPMSGLVAATLETTSPTLPRLAVYKGADLENLTRVAENLFGESLGSVLAFEVEQGETLHIAVDEDRSSPKYVLDLKYVAPPNNDAFTGRTHWPIPFGGGWISFIPGHPGQTFLVSTVGATREPDEPDHTGEGSGHSVWYHWTPSGVPRDVTIFGAGHHPSLSNRAMPASAALPPGPFIAVYYNNFLTNLVLVAKGAESVRFNATPGAMYQIAIDGLNGHYGDYLFRMMDTGSNDHFETAFPLDGAAPAISFPLLSVQSATLQPGEPNHAGRSRGNSLWWKWIPELSGTYSMKITRETQGPNFIILTQPNPSPSYTAAIYSGAGLSDLQVVASNLLGALTFFAQAKTPYHIAIDLDNQKRSAAAYSLQEVTMATLTKEPGFLPPTWRENGSLRFRINGAPGNAFTLQTSLDLFTWTSLTNVTMRASDFIFDEWPYSEWTQRFFRLMQIESP
jgi:hypothetical protein